MSYFRFESPKFFKIKIQFTAFQAFKSHCIVNMSFLSVICFNNTFGYDTFQTYYIFMRLNILKNIGIIHKNHFLVNIIPINFLKVRPLNNFQCNKIFIWITFLSVIIVKRVNWSRRLSINFIKYFIIFRYLNLTLIMINLQIFNHWQRSLKLVTFGHANCIIGKLIFLEGDIFLFLVYFTEIYCAVSAFADCFD